jgi:hypothetical protein
MVGATDSRQRGVFENAGKTTVAPRVDAAAKAALIAVVRAGGCAETGAAALGLTLRAFQAARKSDAAFARLWRNAQAASASRERRRRRAVPGGGAGEVRIAPNNRRVLQKRNIGHVKFDIEAQQVFLAHFCATCDCAAAAAEAGVCENTVLNHRRRDPAFAEEYDAALDQGYVRLEAEALRQRLIVQQRLRAVMEVASLPEGSGGGREDAALTVEAAAEFERVLKLLDRADRKARRPRRTSGGRHKVWTFDTAMALLDERLKALGVPVSELPPEVAARYDGAGEREGGE